MAAIAPQITAPPSAAGVVSAELIVVSWVAAGMPLHSATRDGYASADQRSIASGFRFPALPSYPRV